MYILEYTFGISLLFKFNIRAHTDVREPQPGICAVGPTKKSDSFGVSTGSVCDIFQPAAIHLYNIRPKSALNPTMCQIPCC